MTWFSFLKKEESKSADKDISTLQTPNLTEKILVSFDHYSLKVISLKGDSLTLENIIWREEVSLHMMPAVVGNLAINLEKSINELKHRIEGALNVLVALPLDSVFTKYIVIPRSNMTEKILQAEMKKQIPLPFSEVMFAYNKVREIGNQEAYFCIVIHRILFENYQTVFKNYGMHPYFELGVFSLARLAPMVGVYAILWFGNTDGYIALVKDQVVVDLRQFGVGADYVLKLSKMYDLTIEDAELLWNSYKENYSSINQVSSQAMMDIEFEVGRTCAYEVISALKEFDTEHKVPIEKLLITGSLSLKEIKLSMSELGELSMEIESLLPASIMQKDNNLIRYTHQFGLAKHNL